MRIPSDYKRKKCEYFTRRKTSKRKTGPSRGGTAQSAPSRSQSAREAHQANSQVVFTERKYSDFVEVKVPEHPATEDIALKNLRATLNVCGAYYQKYGNSGADDYYKHDTTIKYLLTFLNNAMGALIGIKPQLKAKETLIAYLSSKGIDCCACKPYDDSRVGDLDPNEIPYRVHSLFQHAADERMVCLRHASFKDTPYMHYDMQSVDMEYKKLCLEWLRSKTTKAHIASKRYYMHLIAFGNVECTAEDLTFCLEHNQ